MSGVTIATRRSPMIWVGALLQFAMATIFLLVFRFPKFTIAIFGGMIALGTLLSVRAKGGPVAAPAPQKPLSHPALFKILSLGIALCSIALFATVLFGFVIFLNNWNDWHRYEGQPYHATTFQVTHVYFQRVGKGGIDAYASGVVDGGREWMGLRPYLKTVPRSQEELDGLVPDGTTIAIYLFPEMKGRSRVRVYSKTPTTENYRRAAMNAVNYGLAGLGICLALIFALSRLRRMCFVQSDSALQSGAAAIGR
jgi:hypothetical protein